METTKLIKTAQTLAADPEGNEATLVHRVVVPALVEMVGYKHEEIRFETHPNGGAKRRMDALAGRGTTELVVEAKAAGENLRTGRRRADALRQIRSYIRGRRDKGADATGLVTNGLTWIRIGADGLPGTDIHPRDDEELGKWLETERAALNPEPGGPAEAMERLCQLQKLPNAGTILTKVTGRGNPATPGLAYGTAAYVETGEPATETDGQLALPVDRNQPRSVGVWVIRLEGGDAGPDDVADTLAELEAKGALRPGTDARGAAVAKNGHDGGPAVRAWVRRNGRLTMTTAWHPVCDGTKRAAAKHIDRVFDFGKTVREIEEGLDTKTLQKQFYSDMREWFQAPAADGRPAATEAALQHLLRIIFCRLMTERGVLPENILDCGAPEDGGGDGEGVDRHRALLKLFREDLARPGGRPDLPWLNGSLFTPPRGDDPPVRLDREYRSPDRRGLLDILDRYEWTTVENRSQAGTHAIDPAVLSCMFESLVATTKPSTDGQTTKGATANPQMPLGAYYTPADMAEAMTAEALAGAVRRKLSGAPMSEEEVRGLFEPVGRKAWNDHARRRELLDAMKAVTVVDPGAGSGAFLLTCTRMLATARRRLGDRPTPGSGRTLMEDVVARQVQGADLDPGAATIAKLRLYIAIQHERDAEPSTVDPLPNLETRVLCADSLWTPLKPPTLIRDPEWQDALDRRRRAEAQWVEADSPAEKENAGEALKAANLALLKLYPGMLANGREHRWDGHPAHQTIPFRGDLPALAGMPDGWDLVIGNPPYMNVLAGQARMFKRLGYAAGPGNLYEAFLESAAERLVKRNGSLMMIVPHSIQWSVRTGTLRGIIEEQFPEIRVRTYDNRPAPVFPKTSWLEDTTNAESRQRVSVVHAEGRKHRGTTRVRSTGLIRLTAPTRADALRRLTPTGGPAPSPAGTDGAWPATGTPELARLLAAMTKGPAAERHTQALTRPRTACYFLTMLRPEHLSNGSRTPVHPAHDGPLDSWLALYNSRLFHSLWLITGDAFHVTDRPYRIAKAPHAWADARLTAEAARLGKALTAPANLKACKEIHSGRDGTRWPNFNFHSERAPESRRLVEEIDRLLLKGYGLEPEPLLTQMETIRVGSAHVIAARNDKAGK